MGKNIKLRNMYLMMTILFLVIAFFFPIQMVSHLAFFGAGVLIVRGYDFHRLNKGIKIY